MQKYILLIILVLVITDSFCTAGDSNQNRFNSAGLQEKEVKLFFDTIQKAISQNDIYALSKLTKYPIYFYDRNGHKFKVSNAKDFTIYYSKYVDESWKKSVIQQKFENLSASWEGVMFGDDEIWFSGICNDETCVKYEIKIIKINPLLTPTNPNNHPVSTSTAKAEPIIASNGNQGLSWLYGEWAIADYKFTGISSLSSKEANSWIGKRAVYKEKSVFFDNKSCSTANYHCMIKSEDDFYLDFKTYFSDLGINSSNIEIIEISCGDNEWIAPGGLILHISEEKIMSLWEGVFFILKKNSVSDK